MTVLELRERVRLVRMVAIAMTRVVLTQATFTDVLRAIAEDPTRTDAHALAAEALRVLE